MTNEEPEEEAQMIFGDEHMFTEGPGVPDLDPDDPPYDEVFDLDQLATPLNLEEILDRMEYPDEAYYAEIEGTVLLRVLVSEDGRYKNHRVLLELHPSLVEEITSEIEDLRFSPAMHEGEAVRSWINIPIRFDLNEGIETH